MVGEGLKRSDVREKILDTVAENGYQIVDQAAAADVLMMLASVETDITERYEKAKANGELDAL